MIKSIQDRRTAQLVEGLYPKNLARDVAELAHERLLLLNRATTLADLVIVRVEKMRTDRKGQHSIRVKGPWRVCFKWTGHDAEDVEFVNYHKG